MPGTRTTLHGPTMGTRWSASVDADASLDLAALRRDLAAAVQQIDEQMSPWKPDSDLMRLNRAPVDAWVELPAGILEVLACALDINRLSAGAFDPGVGALVDAWGFGAVRDAAPCARVPGTRPPRRPRPQARPLAAGSVRHCQGLRGRPHGRHAAAARGAACTGGT
ncbi:MAG: FAD:protein FMN transferase [Thiobacillus sp.]|nr:FAD:protein FMN transferase [Thiobacillus sp.]